MALALATGVRFSSSGTGCGSAPLRIPAQLLSMIIRFGLSHSIIGIMGSAESQVHDTGPSTGVRFSSSGTGCGSAPLRIPAQLLSMIIRFGLSHSIIGIMGSAESQVDDTCLFHRRPLQLLWNGMRLCAFEDSSTAIIDDNPVRIISFDYRDNGIGGEPGPWHWPLPQASASAPLDRDAALRL